MKSPFNQSLIEQLVAAVAIAEVETFDEYNQGRISEEDHISGSLSQRIQDECNRIFSKRHSEWRCYRTILRGRGANSPEKIYGFDIAITLSDEKNKEIKTVIIQDKFENNNDPNLKSQVESMEKLTTNGSFVGVFASDGMYVSSTEEVKNVDYNIKDLTYPDKAKRLPKFMESFFVCETGHVGLDPLDLHILSEKDKDTMLLLFTKGTRPYFPIWV